MSFSTILFSEKGRALQAKVQAGTALNFSKIEMGSGSLDGQSQITLTNLISPQVTLSISELSHSSNYAIIKGNFSNKDLSTGFYWREIGVFAQDPDLGEILYCYGNAGELAEYIPPQTSGLIEKVVAISAIVGDTANVTASINSSLEFATKADISAINLRMIAVETPQFEDYESGTTVPTAETALSNIKKGISLLTILQYIKAFCKGVVTLSRLANNLVTTAEGLALDARQGKALKDLIDLQNDNLGNIRYVAKGVLSESGTYNFATGNNGIYLVSGSFVTSEYGFIYLIINANDTCYTTKISDTHNVVSITSVNANVTLKALPTGYTMYAITKIG